MSETEKPVFTDVYYSISPTLPLPQRKRLTTLLNTNGGTPIPASSPNLTHYVTLSLPSQEPIEALPHDSTAQLVTPRWVERSLLIGLQDSTYYSPDPVKIFSGVVASASDLSQADLEIMSAGITALGGQWRTGLTREVSHLFALTNGSVKYETGMHFKDEVGMKILVPHWFDDSVRLGIRGLSTEEYEWPDPQVFKVGWENLSGAPHAQENMKEERKTGKLSDEKKAFFDTALLPLSNTAGLSTPPPSSSKNVWNGHKIVLTSGLDLTKSQRLAHEADIKREGGQIVEWSNKAEELDAVDEADILIMRYRSGPVYVKAYKLNKTIGTLPWLWYVRSTGILSRPTEQLLHYPILKKPIEGFANQVITITNYTGKDREYLKQVIGTLGAEFTPSMTSRNTVVIAAFTGGIKVQKARSWSIPLVNHFWLEDCFSQWRFLSMNDPRYTLFPSGVDLSPQVGERGVVLAYDDSELDALSHEDDSPKSGKKSKDEKKEHSPVRRGRSTKKRIVEVEVTDEPGGSAMEVEVIDGDIVEDAVMDGNKKRRRKIVEDDIMVVDDFEVDEQEPRPSSSKQPIVKAKPKSKTSSPAKPTIQDLGVVNITSDEDEAPKMTSAKPSSSKTPMKQTRRRSSISARYLDEDKEIVEEVNRRAASKVSKVANMKGKRAQAADEDEEDLVNVPKTPLPSSKKTAQKTPLASRGRKGKAASKPMNEDVEMEDIEVLTTRSAKKSKPTPKSVAKRGRSQSTTRREVLAVDSDHDEEEELPKRTLRRRASQPDLETEVDKDSPRRHAVPTTPGGASVKSAGRTPGKHSSQPYVSLPTNKELRLREKENSRPNTPAKHLGRTESIRAEAKDGTTETPKRGRPAGRASSRNRSKSKSKSRTRRMEIETSLERSPSPSPAPKRVAKPKTPHRTSKAGPSRLTETPSTTVGRSPSRRTAATNATKKLRDEVMPDVLSFQKQMKRGVVKGSWEENDRSRDKDKSGGKGKPKKRLSVEGDEDEETVDERDKKKQKVNGPNAKGGGKGKGKAVIDIDEDEDVSMVEEVELKKPRKSSGKSASAKPSGKISTTDPKTIRILTTQVTFSEDIVKAMTKMGVKFTTKPAECTHLVAKSLVRTEKFLCAMAVAPFIVTDKWVQTCVATKHILVEDDFLLQDPANEAKFGFKLSEALQRAKENEGKLFSGLTFHITSKVNLKVEIRLLKNVVSAGGGQVLTQPPTHRILTNNRNRYVISCIEDQSIWRPLAENGHTIYTAELILTGMLSQKIDWENEANQIVVLSS